MATFSAKFLAFALVGLLSCEMTLAGDKTLLTKIPQILTVWSDAVSCTAQSQSEVDPDPARVGCATGLTQVQAGNNSNITVYWRGANTTDGATSSDVLSKVTSVQVKACFSDHSTKDRKWRKHKDEIGKDKQCFKKLVETQKWPTGSNLAQIDSYKWTVADNIPKATYFFRVFAYDKYQNTIGYGDSNDLMELPFEHLGRTVGTTNGTYGIGYWKVKGYDGLTSGVVTGVVILSIVSWALLISYFIYEHFIQKED